jgi:hypothetical protein
MSSLTIRAAGATASPSTVADPEFEHERFDVYRVALEFQGQVPRLFPRRGYAALRDQLDRASASVLLNARDPDAHQAGPANAAVMAVRAAPRERRTRSL